MINREKYITNLIKERGFNVKSFANYIEMPYSTLRSILEKGIGGASIDNVIKICKGLNISIDTLKPSDDKITYSSHEEKVILAYRNNPGMQEAVDKLLGIDNSNAELIENMGNTITDIKTPIKQK